MKIRIPDSSHNWISLIGATIALVSFFMIVFLFAITSIFFESSTYIGLVIYILLPAVMIVGLILIPFGMFLSRKKVATPSAPWPKIDLNDPKYRNAFMIFSIGSAIFLFASALGSYQAFHYTESVQFCGELCHDVMKPEYTAYQNSAHARVACVDCHVGSGADWYVRSKLSGLYQVYAVTANVYPRPIPTPVQNLRPARETCEECHWPQKFYAQKLRLERHYLNDEENTPWDINLLMKIGSEHASQGLKEGIHWHINPNTKIEYIATDERLQEIPWVRHTNLETGESVVYQNEDEALDEKEIANAEIHTMDCMDCHNRPSHSYKPPAFFVNEALVADIMPASLPEIKSISMEICSEEMATADSAKQYIEETIKEFYTENYENIVEENPELIDQAIKGLKEVYLKNIFPEMKVRWDAYPNNIGHLEFNGCFRCHNDLHASEDGDVISRDCNLCHTIVAQGSPDNKMMADISGSLEFKHPADIDEAWKEMLCTDCHTGLNP
ncbi:MAG: NapC/NirT family cytochrome c [Calditrichaceae bacterium]